MAEATFINKVRVHAPVADVFGYHAAPGAIERLTPPWVRATVLSRSGGISPGAEVLFRIRKGGFSTLWHARHVAYERDAYFKDMQLKGPLASWVHEHIFTEDGAENTLLEDRIRYRLPLSPLSDILVGSAVTRELTRMFRYRNTVLQQDMRCLGSHNTARPMTIVVSGASGLIGRELVPFLTVAGHRVIQLVRRQPQGDDEIFWDPLRGELEFDKDLAIDAVIHLSGENIATGRWSRAKKAKILESRLCTTDLLVEKLSHHPRPPQVFISSSAVGYYGDCGQTPQDEHDGPGSDFISTVCHRWEEAAVRLEQAGVRVVLARIGLLLSPAGGGLEQMLRPFRFGTGGRVAGGDQFMSWISMDDALGVFYHLLMDERAHGPVNIVAPQPVTNREFTRILGGVVGRPTLCTVPAWVIKAVWGQMGRELLLAGVNVKATKLEQLGYVFRHRHLEGALRHLLGKEEDHE